MRGAHLLAVLLGAAQALSLGAEEVARAQGAGQPTPSLSPPTLQPSLPPPTPGPTIESNEPAPAVPETSPAASQAAPDASQPNSADQPPLAAAPDATDPVVAVIRSKLADPSQAKGADANDIAALGTFYASRTGKPLWITEMGFSAKGQAVIFEIEKADEWGLDAKTFVLPSAAELPASLEAQALAEIKLDLAILKYARYARGGRFVPSSISELYDQTPSLRDPKIVLAEIESADAPDRYLQLLHPKHEQFARLRQALLAARAPEEEGGKQAGSEKDVRRIIINMERWRWMPEDLGSLYVWNNSPEFKLYLVKDGKPIFADKTLVGTIGYATPVFTADMKTIVFNPEWNAPETVVKENIWPPLQERNYSILRIHKLSVSYNGTPVDPTRVDWRRVNPLSYTFSQKPGPHNNLGKVKFLFPNRHTVYMHDTLPVRKKYFKQTVRMIGHECVRMEKPAQFAEILLAEDKGWSASQVKDLWDKGVNSSVSIDKTIPVHMVYFTAVVDETGKVATWADVYGLDRKLAVALFGDATGFPQPPPESKQPGGEAGATAPAARRTTADNDIARAIQGFLGD
jgi:L,D-transpeptidase YcbB